MKEVQQLGTFYKLVLSPSLGFEVVVFVDLQGTMVIYGVDGIPDYYRVLLALNYTSYGNLNIIIQNLKNALASPPPPIISTLPKLASI
jgi:hypothetical protein